MSAAAPWLWRPLVALLPVLLPLKRRLSLMSSWLTPWQQNQRHQRCSRTHWLGFERSKDLVEGAPKPIKEGVSKDEANKIKEVLTKAGATVEIK